MADWVAFGRDEAVRKPSYRVELTPADRDRLVEVTRTGSHPVRMVARAKILLELDVGGGRCPASQVVIAERVQMSVSTVSNVGKEFVDKGGDVDAVISRKKRLTPPVPPKVTGDVEAKIIAMACGAPPPGRARWTLRLLERHVMLDEGLPDVDHTTICRILKKTNYAHINSGCG
jgi:hypothetical protein